MGVNICLILLFVFFSGNCIAGWNTEKEIISGKWGKEESEFSFKKRNPWDGFPNRIYITADEKIIIRDLFNGRRKIYNDKNLEKITQCIEQDDGSWNEECNILGNYLSTNSAGNIWTKQEDQYRLSAPTGELILSNTERPLELGIKKTNRRSLENKFDATVRYEDITYQLALGGNWDNFVRDNKDYIYFYDTYTAIDKVSGEETITSFVVKYDKCGKKIGRLDLPISEYEPIKPEQYDRPTIKMTVRNEYGPPVIGPDGSIYAWKRTPDTYSILKWEWVDDPSDPKPGPDTPDNFQVIPANQSIYVTWNLSPQDPGCVDTYEIERATSADGIYSTIATVDKGEQSYNDASALPGTDYFYRLRAVADDLYSDFTTAMSGKWTGQ